MNALNLLESAWQDLRYGARVLFLNKGFFAVATLSLALGIGANTAIFQLLDAVRLRLLPIAHPEELAELKIAENEHCCNGNFSDRRPNFTFAQWDQIRQHQQTFSGIFAWGDSQFNLTDSGEARSAEGLFVSGDFFRTLGVQPLLGRLFTNADDQLGCGSPGAVVSYPFWQRQFGGDNQVLGKTVSWDGHRLPVVGVTPASFFGVEVGRSFDVAVPVCAEPLLDGENSHLAKRADWWLAVIGRLKPGWSVARANAQAQAMSPQVFGSTVPPNYRPDMVKYYGAYKLKADLAGSGVSGLRRQYEEPLWLLLGIAGLVLLIACSNLANLLLARAGVREREMAVRLAIGAGRGRLIRQLLLESLLLTLVGTAAGAMLAQFLSRYLVEFLTTAGNPLFVDLGVDWRVLLFTTAVAVLTCMLFGLTPALRATRTAPAAAMKSSGRNVAGNRERFGLRRALVISQVSLSLVLLVAALLFVESLRNLVTLDAGFSQNGLLIANIDASRLHFPAARRAALYQRLLDGVRATPGIQKAASTSIVPISGNGSNNLIEVLGQKPGKQMVPWFEEISAGYFQTMGTQLIAGRDFDARDAPSAPEAAIVNQEFCAKFLAGSNPLGRQFRIVAGPGETPHLFQIVGLVKNSKYQSLREDFKPIAFFAATQNKETALGTNFLVRSNLPLGALMSAVKAALLRENAGLSMQFQSFPEQVKDSLLRERLMASLSAFFGFLAAILATIGLYGVISYMVERRRSEIGIRIALGASRGSVVNLILKEAVFLLAAGLVIGIALAAGAGRAAGSLLYGLKPADPTIVALAAALLGLAALTASLIPALRAAGAEPMAALREE